MKIKKSKNTWNQILPRKEYKLENDGTLVFERKTLENEDKGCALLIKPKNHSNIIL